MQYQVKVNGRTALVELVSASENKLQVSVDGKQYEIDYVKVNPDSVSIIYANRSFKMELIAGSGIRQYLVNTIKNTYTVDIIDAEARYLSSRKQGQDADADSVIKAPIPGRVIKIMVSENEQVEAGQNLIVISAMKMESDYKAPRSGKILAIHVKEGQTVEARQVLIEIE
jgi:biotin carboxyl carrier protein